MQRLNQAPATIEAGQAVPLAISTCPHEPDSDSTHNCTTHCCLAAAISRTIPALVSVYDFRLKELVWTNDRFDQFFGMGAADGKPLLMSRLAGQLHPDDMPKFQGKLDSLRHLSVGTDVSVEVRVFDHAGECRWVKCHDSVTEVDDQNRPLRAIGIAFDITERRRTETALQASEEMFRRTAEHMSDTFYIVDRSGYVVHFLNKAAAQLTGIPVAELMSGGTAAWFKLVDLRDFERVQTWFDRWVSACDSTATPQIEYRLRHRNGSIRWVDDRLFAITNEAGEVVRYGGICTDITERKRAERRMRRRDRVLQNLVRRRTLRVRDLERQRAEQDRHVATGRMAARIAHEINNPLAGVKNAFRLVRDAIPTEHPHHHFAGKIESEIDRIAKIVRQMYTLYRPEAERPRQIDVGSLVRDLIVMLTPRLEQRQVSIAYRPSCADCSIMAPESGFREILLNLTANAVEASAPGSTVTVSCQLTEGFYCVTVADKGCGIAAEHQALIFEPFFTTKRSQDGAGMGLGLSVAQSLVLAMRGTISFTSAPGEGTAFTVCIPQGLTKDMP